MEQKIKMKPKPKMSTELMAKIIGIVLMSPAIVIATIWLIHTFLIPIFLAVIALLFLLGAVIYKAGGDM